MRCHFQFIQVEGIERAAIFTMTPLVKDFFKLVDLDTSSKKVVEIKMRRVCEHQLVVASVSFPKALEDGFPQGAQNNDRKACK